MTEKFPSAKNVLLERVQAILQSGDKRDAKLAFICQAIHEIIPHCNWVGFYLIDDSDPGFLLLGPFVGEPTEHVRIPIGRGICGMVVERGESIIIADVSKETNYLSCSTQVKSEIVVPIFKNGKVIGELDIDSHRLAAFGDEEKVFYERLCTLVSKFL